MLEKSALSDAIDSVLQDEARITTALVPGLAQLGAKEQPLPPPLLTRLRIEAVRRVWATADVHALALVAMLGEDYDAARSWSGYVQTAINRDKRLLEELAINEVQIRVTPPLRATVAMIESLATDVFKLGALPAVAYAIFVEWNVEKATPFARLLEPAVGAKRDAQAAMLVEQMHRLISRRPELLPLLFVQLRQVSAFMRACFAEVSAYAGLGPMPMQGQAPAPPKGP